MSKCCECKKRNKLPIYAILHNGSAVKTFCVGCQCRAIFDGLRGHWELIGGELFSPGYVAPTRQVDKKAANRERGLKAAETRKERYGTCRPLFLKYAFGAAKAMLKGYCPE